MREDIDDLQSQIAEAQSEIREHENQALLALSHRPLYFALRLMFTSPQVKEEPEPILEPVTA